MSTKVRRKMIPKEAHLGSCMNGMKNYIDIMLSRKVWEIFLMLPQTAFTILR